MNDGRKRSAAEITTWLQENLAAALDLSPEEIDVDTRFTRLGLDSTDAVVLTADLEGWLDRRVQPTAAWDHPTIAKLAAALAGES